MEEQLRKTSRSERQARMYCPANRIETSLLLHLAYEDFVHHGRLAVILRRTVKQDDQSRQLRDVAGSATKCATTTKKCYEVLRSAACLLGARCRRKLLLRHFGRRNRAQHKIVNELH